MSGADMTGIQVANWAVAAAGEMVKVSHATAQYQLPASFTTTLAYFGNYGSRLPFFREINFAPFSEIMRLRDLVFERDDLRPDIGVPLPFPGFPGQVLDVARALRHYLKAIELVHTRHPSYDVVYANLADLMLKLGDYRKAFDLAAEAAQRNPDDARNLFLTGKALVKLERYDVSLQWLERAATLDLSYPEPRYLLAQAYRHLGRTADAERALNAFKEVHARTPAARR